jgi:hypothetical protein
MKFEAGKTYKTRSICDYDCVFSYSVVSRSDKTITVAYRGAVKRCKIQVGDGVEFAYPEGRYSMAPVIKADRCEV